MNSFLKGFLGLFDWMSPKTVDETINDLDNQMQDLYDRMGWGQYKKPSPMSGWNNACDLNRVLEAEQSLMNEIYGYNFRKIVTKEFHKPIVKDPARRRINKYL
jgi:hypothetical protein